MEMYKIVYICDFYERTYKDCLGLYIGEEKENKELNNERN